MDKFLNIKYTLHRQDEYFDDYLASIGLNYIQRKLAKTIPASVEIVKLNENEYSFNTILPFKTHQQRFVPGEEIEQTTVDGRKVKNIFTIEGNKLIEHQFEPNRQVSIIREFTDKEMAGKTTVGNSFGEVTNKHWSKAQES
ncbi:CLUMA_CG015416, isoform A [Clunio marinus]|uniref:CLUMA_CG015416, isoform A n=1 Tax=Clunio marinus TaxID=568069 RepID=A0A1J1ITE9_9DIPT|nr:CLUMA_CG015416, isoform A [Clunio marinus]